MKESSGYCRYVATKVKFVGNAAEIKVVATKSGKLQLPTAPRQATRTLKIAPPKIIETTEVAVSNIECPLPRPSIFIKTGIVKPCASS